MLVSEHLAELYTKKMFQLLQSAYSTIRIQDTALFLGMNEDNSTNSKWGTTEQKDRSILWKVARKDSSGNYVTECDKVMGEAIEEMLEQRKEGKLIEIGTNDILTQVLGTAEHLRRVRGQSQGVTQRDYFHKPIGGGGGSKRLARVTF
ncbi:uncharacterized protein LOC133801335 isoform X3 [Humulus lupulus]|uniref:uncharacterized protein LOC133801335 isoform X3 n=1 Tax=Humulus lupulus TaxID=3486 RepID=UPI002B408CAD|nr:uncharacterized protein LOC133801335 isoform X3 [Humulus lupulus]